MIKYFGNVLIACLLNQTLWAQATPKVVVHEPDEGGYPQGYTPAAKLGVFDLNSTAPNEPFRHLYKVFSPQKVVWDDVADFRDYGFRALFGEMGEGMPKENRYLDINEGIFRDEVTVEGESLGKNPIYLSDPNRDKSAQGKTFVGVNGPAATITIDNVDEAAKFNPFLITEREIDRRAKAAAPRDYGYIRWDIEAIPINDINRTIKGRQVWEGGKYRHQSNGGTDAFFRNMDDNQFYNYAQERWSYVYTELIYKTKLYSQSKVWLYSWGPSGQMDPSVFPQFGEDGTPSVWWKNPIGFWKIRNRFNNRTIADELSYFEPPDLIQYYGMWSVLQPDPINNIWGNTGFIKLKTTPKTTTTVGVPTRYHLTDIGSDPNTGNRRIRVSLHAQDGSLRVADKTYRVIFQHYLGNTHIDLPKGASSIEMTTTSPFTSWVNDDFFMAIVWNTIYVNRYHEPTKLGFINWEPTPRTFLNSEYALSTTDLFEQPIHDAVVGFSNLQNCGVVTWDANTVGKVNPMVRENVILAQKKIAPYKGHIENQTPIFADISLDGGQTWILGGYPNAPFQERYNGWWMKNLWELGMPFPMFMASYNAQSKTFLVGHMMGNLPTGQFDYTIRVKVPNSTETRTFTISSSKEFKYSLFQI